MKMNMSVADRVLRSALIVVLATLYFTHVLPAIWAWPLIGVGTIFLATSFTGFCPIYAVTGWSSKKKNIARH